MNKPNLLIGVFLSIALMGCSSIESNNIDSDALAPSSISGKTFQFTIASGSGVYPSTGTWTVVISDTNNQYVVTGDTVNTDNSAGLFTYKANGDKGRVYFYDSAPGKGHLYLTFTSSTSGTYTADAVHSSYSHQSGSFVEQ